MIFHEKETTYGMYKKKVIHKNITIYALVMKISK